MCSKPKIAYFGLGPIDFVQGPVQRFIPETGTWLHEYWLTLFCGMAIISCAIPSLLSTLPFGWKIWLYRALPFHCEESGSWSNRPVSLWVWFFFSWPRSVSIVVQWLQEAVPPRFKLGTPPEVKARIPRNGFKFPGISDYSPKSKNITKLTGR